MKEKPSVFVLIDEHNILMLNKRKYVKGRVRQNEYSTISSHYTLLFASRKYMNVSCVDEDMLISVFEKISKKQMFFLPKKVK